eukprot:TRINITY_DN966_c5_g1_i1.p1 TRINITY_DN966_c5_g1~~TRINITY_DN966_c5_g1_i1.p1  ORF type:complete len:551 (+),score=180.56 TRINITY_DN966_c5_g1_i1:35-1654(+)
MPTAKDRVAELKRRLGQGGAKRTANEAFGKKKEKLEGVDWMLNGLGKEKFLRENWEKKGVHIKRGDGKYYEGLKGLGTIDQLWERMEKGDVVASRINVFRCLDKNTKETPATPPADWKEIKKYFDEGWSLQWLQPQHEDDDLARLVAVLESQLGSLVGVNAYLTPPHVQGLAPHYDDVEVFVLQLSGSKKWSLHATTAETPLPEEHQTLPRFQSHDLQLDLLSPAYFNGDIVAGDLLYFPRGTIHYAPSVGDVPSVHLTISTYQRWCNYEVIQRALEEAMASIFQTDPLLRQGLPWGATALNADTSYASRAVSTALQNVQRVLKESDCTQVAVQSMSADVVNHRMPPFLKQPDEESVQDVTSACKVMLPDPSVLCFNEAMPSEDGEVVYTIAHSMFNDRSKHMLGTKPGDEEEEDEEEEEGEEVEEDEEDEEDPMPRNYVPIPEMMIDNLMSLAATSPKVPINVAYEDPAALNWSSAVAVSQMLSGVPKNAHPIILSTVKKLEALKILLIQRPPKKAQAQSPVAQPTKHQKKKKKVAKK